MTSSPPPKPRNLVGRIALAVSIIGLTSMWGAIPLGSALRAELAGTVVCVAGWILMPIGFIIGCAALLWSQKGKSAAVTAILISTVGSISSFVVLILRMMLASVFHYLPN